METKILEKLKEITLSLDTDSGVDRAKFEELRKPIRQYMGVFASCVLTNALELDEDKKVYFPKEGDALRTWKCMVVAYKDEMAREKAREKEWALDTAKKSV